MACSPIAMRRSRQARRSFSAPPSIAAAHHQQQPLSPPPSRTTSSFTLSPVRRSPSPGPGYGSPPLGLSALAAPSPPSVSSATVLPVGGEGVENSLGGEPLTGTTSNALAIDAQVGGLGVGPSSVDGDEISTAAGRGVVIKPAPAALNDDNTAAAAVTGKPVTKATSAWLPVDAPVGGGFNPATLSPPSADHLPAVNPSSNPADGDLKSATATVAPDDDGRAVAVEPYVAELNANATSTAVSDNSATTLKIPGVDTSSAVGTSTDVTVHPVGDEVLENSVGGEPLTDAPVGGGALRFDPAAPSTSSVDSAAVPSSATLKNVGVGPSSAANLSTAETNDGCGVVVKPAAAALNDNSPSAAVRSKPVTTSTGPPVDAPVGRSFDPAAHSPSSASSSLSPVEARPLPWAFRGLPWAFRGRSHGRILPPSARRSDSQQIGAPVHTFHLDRPLSDRPQIGAPVDGFSGATAVIPQWHLSNERYADCGDELPLLRQRLPSARNRDEGVVEGARERRRGWKRLKYLALILVGCHALLMGSVPILEMFFKGAAFEWAKAMIWVIVMLIYGMIKERIDRRFHFTPRFVQFFIIHAVALALFSAISHTDIGTRYWHLLPLLVAHVVSYSFELVWAIVLSLWYRTPGDMGEAAM